MHYDEAVSCKNLIKDLIDLHVETIISVPDGYIVDILRCAQECPELRTIITGREEECLGIATGYALTGARSLVMIQNVGFLNSIGCFLTLVVNYGVPLVILVTNRGALYDANVYDPPKYAGFQRIRNAIPTPAFDTDWARLSENLKRSYVRAEAANEPVILVIDRPRGTV
jgi:sulfopyruvate decarboxylase TPP-binding subunit